jgi:DNA-directed RNA polymerase subunit RPC12/RpoP
MDDGDGAFAIELMAGLPQQAILQTIYNGSASCQGCGSLMNPTQQMYLGNRCPDCMTKKHGKHVQTLVGR